MDDDTDRSSESEATQLQGNSTAEETHHHHRGDDDAEDSAAVTEDDSETDDQRNVSSLQVSPMVAEEDSRNCQSFALILSDLSEVPVKYEMRRDELERLKNQLKGSHQEALATVIAQAAQIKSPGHPSSLNADVAEPEQKKTNCSKSSSAIRPVKIPNDTYTWRKYGQKQVKSPEGSRSYYKCSYSSCDAKKIESCDQFNSIPKIVYKGHHKHDPPKVFSSPKSLKRKSISTPIQVGQIDESELTQRVKKSSSESHVSKKAKFIVHAAADVEISADGYRWRKYGQKMVRGNPHPRNYYKCTSAGCLVRKQIEKAVDGSAEVMITYKGVHDHDMPVPKKGHTPPNPLLVTASDKRRERRVLTTEAAKTSESARTLLSVGFEIKHC